MSRDIARKLTKRQKVLAHELVAQTAEDMALAVYEELMKDNVWYSSCKAAHPSLSGEALQRAFARQTAPAMIRQARATLASMLGKPQYEHLHEQISEALILDNGFSRDPRRSIFRH